MDFAELYFSPKGRISRSTFWLKGVLPMAALALFVFVLDLVSQAEGALCLGGLLLLTWPSFAILIKRLHDQDKSGWWSLIGLVPVWGQVPLLIVSGFFSGTPGDNRYGQDPLNRSKLAVTDTRRPAPRHTRQPASTGKRSQATPVLTKGVSQGLERLKTRISALPRRHPFGGVAFGTGPRQGKQHIDIICRNIDQAIQGLETGQDPHGNPITPRTVGSGLQQLVADTQESKFEAVMMTALSPDGIHELKGHLVELDQIAKSLK
jgi:uncharacterized membrane protein YhaH (DUF805 family)